MADQSREMLLKLLINAQDNSGPATRSANQNIETLASTAQKVATLVKGYLTYQVVVNGLEQFVKLGDTYKVMAARVKEATGSVEAQAAAQEKLFAIAQDAGAAVDGLAKFFYRVSEASKSYHATQADTLKLTEAVALSFKAQGTGAAEVNSTITQLTQALSTDAVQWQDFGMLADTNLKLVNVAAKNLGYDGLGALKTAMENGKVSNAALAGAIVKGFDEIKRAADAMPVTAEQAMTKLNNALLVTVGRVNEATHASERWAGLLDRIAQGMNDPKLGSGFMAEATAVWLAGLDRMSGGAKVNLAAIHQEFQDRRAGIIKTGQDLATVEADTAEKVKAAQAAQREAFTLTEAKLKEATKLMEGHYTRQTEAALFGLAAKKAAIEGSALNETVQAQRIAEAERVSLSQRLQAIGLYGQQRIALINQTLGTQAQIEQLAGQARQAAETASLEARKAAYGDLAKAYAAVVDDLQGQWQREMQLFQAGTEGIKNLALSHEQQILELKRLGMTEREKLRSEEQERDTAIAKYKAEAAKGAQADEKELNRLYGEATKLIGEVSQSKIAQAKYAVDKSTEIHKAESGLNELYDLQKGALEKIAGQHKTNADTLLPSLDTAKGKLAEMNTALETLDKQLAQAKALKLELDPASLAAAQTEIAKLTATETKTIVVQTVSSDHTPAPAIEGKRWGGLITPPSPLSQQGAAAGTPLSQRGAGGILGGEGAWMVRNLANGGKLPGYGGGDRRLILAEDGEVVVNKEASANNADLLHKINRYGALQKFASGGTVADPVARAYEAAFTKRLDDKLTQMVNNSYGAASSLSGGGREYWDMDTLSAQIKTAIDRAPPTIQDSLRQKVLEKLYAISTQADTSVDKIMDYTNDPMSTLQVEPGTLAKVQANQRYWRAKIAEFGGQDIGGAALGGFKRYDAGLQRDMPYATDISGNVPTATAPTGSAGAKPNRASLQETIGNSINAALADAAKVAETVKANLGAAGAGQGSTAAPGMGTPWNPTSSPEPSATGYANPTTPTIRLELALPSGKAVPADVPSRFEADLREVKRQMRAT